MLNHEPVMLKEVQETLGLRPGQTVVDGTLGLAGHSLAFAESISPNGTLIGFDWDQELLARAQARLAEGANSNDTVKKLYFHSDYREIESTLAGLGIKANAIFLDLGLNSAHLDDPERGIAFKTEGPLDMRMDRSAGEPASALLNRLSPSQIEAILFDLGDERWAKAISKSIIERRKSNPLRTTQDLVEAVLAAIPVGARDKRIHPATRTFQAVRIAVNRELDELNGVLAILSYHSGEDRAAKTACRALAENGFEELFRKPLTPSATEVSRNPRSRSAKLRAVRRTQG
jgi:16S rRNA (cytosine1402-N4)-methyltransferase